MREIKFRAWFRDKMIKPMSLQKMIHQKDNTIPLKVLEKEIIFMQYAGLKDKNRVEIYEGDIVYCNDVYYEVIWETAKAVVFKISKSSEIKYPKICKWYFGFIANDHIEVVGNIYENPELLNK